MKDAVFTAILAASLSIIAITLIFLIVRLDGRYLFPKIPKILGIGFLGLLALGSGLLAVVTLIGKPSTQQQDQPLIVEAKPESSDNVKEKHEQSDDYNYLLALSNLESQRRLEGKEELSNIKAIFEKAETAARKVKGFEFSGDVTNGLGMTSPANAQSFAIALTENKYRLNIDKLEVFETDSPDVLQFICVLEAEGQETMYWIGNFNTFAQQAQLLAYFGGTIGVTYG